MQTKIVSRIACFSILAATTLVGCGRQSDENSQKDEGSDVNVAAAARLSHAVVRFDDASKIIAQCAKNQKQCATQILAIAGGGYIAVVKFFRGEAAPANAQSTHFSETEAKAYAQVLNVEADVIQEEIQKKSEGCFKAFSYDIANKAEYRGFEAYAKSAATAGKLAQMACQILTKAETGAKVISCKIPNIEPSAEKVSCASHDVFTGVMATSKDRLNPAARIKLKL